MIYQVTRPGSLISKEGLRTVFCYAKLEIFGDIWRKAFGPSHITVLKLSCDI